jgi:sugar/nucleoside kinase (ribokinase family)
MLAQPPLTAALRAGISHCSSERTDILPDTKYDVIAIGNALVDVLAHADDAFIAQHALEKGAMSLIDAEASDRLYAAMPPGIEMSGGSAGNTIVGIASLGGRAAFVGRVSDDQLGEVFRHDIRAAGVSFDVPAVTGGSPTGRSLIIVTPDAQRTMQTFLGAAAEFGPRDVDTAAITAATVTFLEGYLFDQPPAKQAFLAAAKAAHDAGRLVSLTLSDPFCVERHREEFRDLVKNHVDILFANEDEIISLYLATSFDAALDRVRQDCQIAALTRSEKGSVVVRDGEVHEIAAEPARVVDTTGAGDAYAAGFLYGFTQGEDLPACGRIGSIAAAEIISQVGGRPKASFAEDVARKLRAR